MKIIAILAALSTLAFSGIAHSEVTDSDVLAIKTGYSFIAKSSVIDKLSDAIFVDSRQQFLDHYVVECGHVNSKNNHARYMFMLDRNNGTMVTVFDINANSTDLAKFDGMWDKCKPQ